MGNTANKYFEDKGQETQVTQQSFAARMTESQIIHNEPDDNLRKDKSKSQTTYKPKLLGFE